MTVYKEIYGGYVSGIMKSVYFEDSKITHMTSSESQDFVHEKFSWIEYDPELLRKVLRCLRKGKGKVNIGYDPFGGRTDNLVVSA